MGRRYQLRATVVALRGRQSADAIAEQFGLTKNSVLGIWHRARKQGHELAPPCRPGRKPQQEAAR
jgi:transposase